MMKIILNFAHLLLIAFVRIADIIECLFNRKKIHRFLNVLMIIVSLTFGKSLGNLYVALNKNQLKA